MKTKPDIMDKLITLHHENPGFTDDALFNQMFAGVFAGFETCGATMPAIVTRIARDRQCQARLHRELDEANENGKLSDPPMYDEVSRLPYLAACMSEGIRMHPVVGISITRTVPENGVVIDGHFLPAGVCHKNICERETGILTTQQTQVGINPWVMSYNEQVMENPYEFKPERWLNANKEDRKRMGKHFVLFA